MYLQQDLRRKKLELCKLHTFLFFSFSLCRKNPESNASALLVSIFHVISIVDVSTSITIQDVVLSFDSVDGIVAIQKKNSQQYFHMVIFVFPHFPNWNLEFLLKFDFGPFWEGKFKLFLSHTRVMISYNLRLSSCSVLPLFFNLHFLSHGTTMLYACP